LGRFILNLIFLLDTGVIVPPEAMVFSLIIDPLASSESCRLLCWLILFITALALENPLEPLAEELAGTGLTWKILDGVRISLESLIGGVGRSSFVAERLPPFEDPPEPQEPEAICIACTADAPKDVSLAYFLNCLLVLINLSGRAEAGTLLC